MKPALDLIGYAELLARISHHPDQRDSLLAAAGLNDEDWDAIDEHWQEKMDAEVDEDAPSPMIAQFGDAFARAQRAHADTKLALSEYVDVLRAMRAGGDLRGILSERGLTLATYLAAHTEWTKKALEDDATREELYGRLEAPESEARRRRDK